METDGFLDGVRLADDVNDDDCAGELGHFRNAGEVLLELVELAAEHRGLLLVLGELAAVGLRGRLELAHAADGRTESLRVRERAAEPTLGHVELLDRLGRALDELGDLLLRGDEEDLLAGENRVLEELRGLVEKSDGLREVDDVDTVALVEDVTFHLRVPTLRLMAEVKTGIKHILERDARKGRRRHFHFVFSLNPLFRLIRFGRGWTTPTHSLHPAHHGQDGGKYTKNAPLAQGGYATEPVETRRRTVETRSSGRPASEATAAR